MTWAEGPIFASRVACTLAAMAETQTGVRMSFDGDATATVATGLPVLDHLVGELARTARMRLALEVAPRGAEEEAAAAGRALGEALAEPLRAGLGYGWAILPADEALASAALEISDRPLCVTNVDFSGQRVGGLASDVVSTFFNELAMGAGLNVHIRLIEGRDPQHVLLAIFKALGAALGQACRPPQGGGST
jgi:imidazoleglycerol phosphate dehydratase HisB